MARKQDKKSKKTAKGKQEDKNAKSTGGDASKKVKAVKPKKKYSKKQIIAGVVFLLGVIIWWGLQPLTAGTMYGVCRTYLETYLKYPTTFKITQYDEFGPSTRLFYTYIDEYGGQRSEMIECVGGPNPAGGFVVSEINMNREPISEEKLKIFNAAIPGILKGKPDLVIPRPPKDGFMDLKRD